MSAFPLQYATGESAPWQSAMIPTTLLASNDTVQRRSSRPSTLLSCDSLLAVRLQQEELWKPTKVKHSKTASNVSVFAAHAAHDSLHPLSDSRTSRHMPNINSHNSLPQVETTATSLTKRRLHSQATICPKAPRVKDSVKPVAKLLKSGERRLKFTSVAPVLLQPRQQSRKPRKRFDGWPCSLPIRDTSFRENSRFFYADVFKDEARALRVNGFPIHDEELLPTDELDSLAIKCLMQNFQSDHVHHEDIEISDILFIGDHPDLSITFDLLPHPIHASSLDIHWLLSGSTRFRTFLDCSIGQLRDFLVHKSDVCVRDGLFETGIDPQHIKITFQGMLLRDDVTLQELLVMWEALSTVSSALLQLTLYICSPSEVWGVWQQYSSSLWP